MPSSNMLCAVGASCRSVACDAVHGRMQPPSPHALRHASWPRLFSWTMVACAKGIVSMLPHTVCTRCRALRRSVTS